ncbi:MAB_1171c family putative transporter [Streptosporangium sp. NPDC050280]|uniref:MAB_1171c family putative transporter n=1 Tax=unclassified Streptosporangium TaxID=2632669 RepID=UPI0034431AC5
MGLYVPPLLAWICLVFALLKSDLRARDPARRAILRVLLALALSFTVLAPAPYDAVARFTGVPNLARFLGHAALLEAALMGQVFLLYLDPAVDDPRARFRRQGWWAAGVLAAMALAFALADTPVNDRSFTGRYGGELWVLEYWVILGAYLVPAFHSMGRMAWRYSRLSGNVFVRVGLRLVAAGVIAALVHHVNKALLLAVDRLGYDRAPGVGRLLDALLPLAVPVLILLGATMSAWAPFLRLPALLEWLRRYRVYLVLRPLWRGLYRANPQIALVRPPHLLADLLTPRDLGLRLYRRVIEIRDGRMILRHRLDPDVAAAARERAVRVGVTGRMLDAVVEAATLSAALRAVGNADAAGDAGDGEARAGEPPSVAVPGGDDLASDIAFLCDVARAYRRSLWAWRLSRLPGARLPRRLR